MNSPDQNIRTQSSTVRIVISLGLSEYYVPHCSSDLKPYIGQKFHSLQDGIDFYKEYGATTGFDVRLGPVKRSPDGIILFKFIYCNRQGVKNATPDEKGIDGVVIKKKRRRVSNRAECMAQLVLRYSGGDGYVVKDFDERHSHNLVSQSHRHFMKANRSLDFAHQNFILNCARANIGPMKSYRLFKEVVGSYSNVGCNSVEFKNFSRDLRAYANGVDAQMVLDKLFHKREVCSAFTFDYCVDEHDKLTRLFWADPTSRANYHAFGQAVSFDATYETNKYNMIFAPFTGKDNHDKCVTFGAGLLSSEDAESYSWLFEKFKTCMGNALMLFITDQDPAMKIAVERALPETKHRLCMWHIMKKVKEKILEQLKKDSSFLQKFNDVVWSKLVEPSEFEDRWEEIMNEFGLIEVNWFKSIYDLRHRWIPAYFRDLSLSGLFRTTSVSESVNSFFSQYINPKDNLVQFLMHFESALDSQRHAHDQMNSIDESSFPDLKTPLLFEKHAADVYTTKIFRDVQMDIYSACHDCRLVSITTGEIISVYGIDDGLRVFDVNYNKSDNTFFCGCKKFITDGLLCCHIFAVFKNLKIESIPEKYVVSRWTKRAYSGPGHIVDSVMDDQGARAKDNKFLMNQVHSEYFNCLGLVDGKTDNINKFLRGLRDLKEMLKGDGELISTVSNKHMLFDRFYGSSMPKDISVLPPEPVKTKGSGSRLISRREKAIQRMSKPLRKCGKCKQMTNHDSRNCEKVLSRD